MRLWSLHPRVLDQVGLVAWWREGLLARKVLSGGTKGYRHHPQLHRFRALADPLASLDAYLHEVQREATRRGYRFDVTKLGRDTSVERVPLSQGQLEFERIHLAKKVGARSPAWPVPLPLPHPLFVLFEGPVESWERP